MSGQSPNYAQQLSANCPRGTRAYTSAGRPFTPADLKPCPLEPAYERSNRSLCFPNTDDTTQDFCANMSSKEYSGRPFNPSLDISRHNMQYSQQPYQQKQANQRGSRLNLEYEMARNKEIALGRLRAEEAAACPRPPLHYERQASNSCKPQMAPSSRGREFDFRAEIQRQLAEAESPNVCMKPGRGSINRGRPMDVDRVYDYNMQTCTPAGKSGRALDLQRDLTFRRLNLPTPKQQQRATSCPTPVQYNTPHSTIQRLPRICPRPSQSVSVSPTRSNSPSASRYATPMHERSLKSPRAVAKYPVTPVCRPLRKPVCPVGEETMDSPGNITKSVMTTTTTRPVSPQQTRVCPTPQKSPNISTDLYEHQTPRRRVQNISNITHDNSRQMDSGYGRTPPRSYAAQTPYKSPGQPLNITEQSTAHSSMGPPTRGENITQMESMRLDESMGPKAKTFLNKTQPVPPPPPLPPLDPNSMNCRDLQRTYRSGDQSSRCLAPITPGSKSFDQSSYYNDISCPMEDDYRPLPSRTCPSPMQPQSSQFCPAPTNESYYYNASMFAEPSQYYKRQVHQPDKSYIDLTDETQYLGDDMDISGQELFARSACPIKSEDTNQMHSWRIPPEDLTCYDRAGYETFQSQQPDLSSTMVQTMPSERSDIMDGDFEATEYQELPSSLKPQALTCPPCEQPKASLFRCLAKKLSSTYDFISSLVAPQKSAITLPTDQTTTGQVCEATTFGMNTLFNTSGPQDSTTFDLRNLYATQCNNDTTNFGLNNLFGNKTQTMDEPSYVRECANAKRCGRVQFDNSDKSQVQDPNRTAIRKAEIENLVNDTYCPGIIQETIDGRENFNNYSFNMSLSQEPKDASLCEGPPTEDPMTLLEAFSMRIDKERTEINKDLKETATEEEIEDSLHKYFASQNPSDLNRSIKSLLISEHLQEHEQVEKGKGSSIEAEVQKLVTTFPDNAKVKLIAYTGHTKPANNETDET